MNVGKIWVDIGARASGFNAALSSMVNTNARAMKRMRKQYQGLNTVGMGLTKYLTAPILLLSGLAIKKALDMEEAWARVAKVYDGSRKELRRMEPAIDAISMKYGVQKDQVLGVMEIVSQMGYRGRGALNMVRQGLDFAIVSGMDYESAIRGVVAVSKVFGHTGAKLRADLAVLNQTENAGVVTMEELTYAIGVAGTMAKQAGVSINEFAAMMEALRKTGMPAEMAAQGLKSIFIKVKKGYKDVLPIMQKYHISMKKGNGEHRDTADILMDLSKAWKNMTDDEKQELIQKMAGIHRSSQFVALMEDMSKKTGAYQTILRKTGDTEKNLATYQKEINVFLATGKRLWEKLKATLTILAAKVGNDLLPLFKGLVAMLWAMVKALNVMPSWLRKAVVWFSLFLATLGPIALVLYKILQAITVVKTSLAVLGSSTALGSMGLKGIAAAAGIKLFGAALIAAWGTLALIGAWHLPKALSFLMSGKSWNLGFDKSMLKAMNRPQDYEGAVKKRLSTADTAREKAFWSAELRSLHKRRILKVNNAQVEKRVNNEVASTITKNEKKIRQARKRGDKDEVRRLVRENQRLKLIKRIGFAEYTDRKRKATLIKWNNKYDILREKSLTRIGKLETQKAQALAHGDKKKAKQIQKEIDAEKAKYNKYSALANKHDKEISAIEKRQARRKTQSRKKDTMDFTMFGKKILSIKKKYIPKGGIDQWIVDFLSGKVKAKSWMKGIENLYNQICKLFGKVFSGKGGKKGGGMGPAMIIGPQFKLPKLKFPKFKFPKVKFPKFKLPKLKFPKIKIPAIGRAFKRAVGNMASWWRRSIVGNMLAHASRWFRGINSRARGTRAGGNSFRSIWASVRNWWARTAVSRMIGSANRLRLGIIRHAKSRNASNVFMNIWRKVCKWFYNAGTLLTKYAAAIPRRMGRAIVRNAKAIWKAGITLANKLKNAVYKVLGIKSPSKAFQKIGKYAITGLIKGLNFSQIMKVIKKWFGNINNLAELLFPDLFGGSLGNNPLKNAKFMKAVFNWVDKRVPGKQSLMSGYRPGARVAGSGRRSMHASGRAIDIAGAGKDAVARLVGRVLGIKGYKRGVASSKYGEVLWRTMVGGNHFTHVHMGLKSIPPMLRGLAGGGGGGVWSAIARAARGAGFTKYMKYIRSIVMKESGGNPNADNPSSSAFGLFQKLREKSRNPFVQAQHGMSYIKGRYGNPAKAWAFWKRHHWYHEGGEVPATLLSGERVLSREQNKWFKGISLPLDKMAGGQIPVSENGDRFVFTGNIYPNDFNDLMRRAKRTAKAVQG